MKWFQVDSDTPNDPKISAVTKVMGVAGFGALVLLWCHIADHGTARPGWSINSRRRPMSEDELVAATRLTTADFHQLVAICVGTGHFLRKPWETRRVIAIPAMVTRADVYTQRKAGGGHLRAKYGKSGMTRLEIFERDDHRCAYCQRVRPVKSLEVDHRVPVVQGGTDDPANLTTTCKSCNRKKRTELLTADAQRAPSTLFVESSTLFANNTVQDNTYQVPPVVPLAGGRITKKDLRAAAAVRDRAWGGWCRHEPTCADRAHCIAAIARDRKRPAKVAS